MTATGLTMLLAISCLLEKARGADGKDQRGMQAQVAIENPHCVEVPVQRVQVVHQIICRVVAEEFHVDAEKVDCRLNLVLGEETERSSADDTNGIYTVYLAHWDEATFAISDMRLAVQRMVSRHRWQHMTREIIRRVDQLEPVDAQSFQKSTHAFQPPNSDTGKRCLSGAPK